MTYVLVALATALGILVFVYLAQGLFFSRFASLLYAAFGAAVEWASIVILLTGHDRVFALVMSIVAGLVSAAWLLFAWGSR